MSPLLKSSIRVQRVASQSSLISVGHSGPARHRRCAFGDIVDLVRMDVGRGALNRFTHCERLSRPKGPRGASDEALEHEAAPP